MPKLDSSQFGPNLWLMQEMHERYLRQPDSVSEAWREFFEDYFPNEHQARPPAPQIPEDFGEMPALPAPAAPPAAAPAASSSNGQAGDPLSRADAVLASRMEDSLSVPTATSVRAIPAKLLEVNRNILNNHQARSRSKKVSFTHLLGWAVVKAIAKFPGMNTSYGERDGKPVAIHHKELNLGLAVDIAHDDGSRSLWVPNIKGAGNLSFVQFFAAYEDLIRKVRSRRITPADMEGTTVTLTNPGMLGTVQSVPRLMEGQAAIVGVGAIAFPAEYQGSDPTTLADLGIGKVVTLTSTYDHRVIQGALSGEFLAEVQRMLMGEDEFYEEIFQSVGVPYVPVQWRIDRNPARNSRESDAKQARVLQLINIYRVRGHLLADLDPLDATPPKMPSELDPATYGFTIWDLDRRFPTGTLANISNDRRRRATDISKPETLGNILNILRDAYCRTVGIEYMHISDPVEKRWIQERVEGVDIQLEPSDHDRILAKLNEAEAFEAFLHTKYIGHKRFSLEGALSLIPMMDAVLDAATRASMEESVIGMAHRGRLNVLANIIGKSYTQIFKQFEGDIDPDTVHGSGDVKYHLGASGRYTNPQGVSMPVSVVSNPSHLESVDPVVEGVVRAKQDALNRPEEFPVLPILVHGDAAFAGQGVVAETLNLSQLRGYRTGGTVHIIVNNQVGFTATAGETRSSYYASDVAKMIQAPIFHVNGDDPEACVRVARLAFEYRQAFRKDVVIDMWCYRKWGHNEADEPSYTQPLMYKRIASRRSVRKLYTESLLYRNRLTLEEAEGALEDFRSKLQGAFNAMHEHGEQRLEPVPEPAHRKTPEAVGLATLNSVLEVISRVPVNFALHPKLVKLLEVRGRSLVNDHVDWSVAEALAFGALLTKGISIRMAGQDSRRGTFSQRHAVFIDQETGAEYTPLLRVGTKGAKFLIYDSMLSEFAALGFEYGYSTVADNTLTIWEAQFGDFANGAQVAIDQFIAAGEDKWEQKSSLVMLLPHGFEGQGPEHSSARLERFLALGADDNYRVVEPSTAAQYFHLLLGQGSRTVLKPLVVLTPKSLLRLPAAASGVLDLISGGWQPVLGDPARPTADSVRRLILCTGKVYYDLAAARDKQGVKGVALVRVEQLYPFPVDEIAEELHRYEGAEVMWVQEEPENMGAWRYLHTKFSDHFKVPLLRNARAESASPASGSARAHEREQEQLISSALAGLSD